MWLLIVLFCIGLLLTLFCYGAAANRGMEECTLLVGTCWAIYFACVLTLSIVMNVPTYPRNMWVAYELLIFFLAMGCAALLGDRKWLKH